MQTENKDETKNFNTEYNSFPLLHSDIFVNPPGAPPVVVMVSKIN